MSDWNDRDFMKTRYSAEYASSWDDLSGFTSM